MEKNPVEKLDKIVAALERLRKSLDGELGQGNLARANELLLATYNEWKWENDHQEA